MVDRDDTYNDTVIAYLDSTADLGSFDDCVLANMDEIGDPDGVECECSATSVSGDTSQFVS